MKNTNQEFERPRESQELKTAVEIRSLASTPNSEVVIQPRSESLSRDLSLSLMEKIEKVNANGVTPQTLNASANAAAQIYKLLRLNFDMKKASQ